MIRSIIVARSNNGVIGKDNDLTWHMPADLKFFKRTTKGHYVIMGRKTYESLGGKPLKGRTNIVITQKSNIQGEGVIVVGSLEEAFRYAKSREQEEIFILGGGEIYRTALANDQVDKIYLTEIQDTFEGDTFFPELDPEKWEEVNREEHPSDEQNPYPYAFVVLERRKREVEGN